MLIVLGGILNNQSLSSVRIQHDQCIYMYCSLVIPKLHFASCL